MTIAPSSVEIIASSAKSYCGYIGEATLQTAIIDSFVIAVRAASSKCAGIIKIMYAEPACWRR